ncbi:ATP-binding protein [Dactylosporangium sp. NPDC051485]|uniref:AlbA family DNA-binding domain-containing protein n=1 Tax=Dactylosporangium sp. NPDC051485 TaxID=3154846 RepID=UPI00342EB1CF
MSGHWIDYKRQLYPNPQSSGTLSGGERRKAHLEAARDMASMAVRGGYLIYGVAEDKTNHTFSAYPIDLPVGIAETIDQIARDLVTPPLHVTPHLLIDPSSQPGAPHGFLVIEIDESSDAPHSVDGVYYGRSETAKVKMADNDVERLIRLRGRVIELLARQLDLTVRADPIASANRRVPHLYLPAVPSQGWPDMFVKYSRDRQARIALMQRTTEVTNELRRADVGRDRPAHAMAGMMDGARSQRVRGSWIRTWSGNPTEGIGGMLGVDDDGSVRYIYLAAGNLDNGLDPSAEQAAAAGWPVRPVASGSVVYENALFFLTLDLVRFIDALSREAGYAGNWLFGIHLDRMAGKISANLANSSSLNLAPYDDDHYRHTVRVSARRLPHDAPVVVDQLLRPLFRNLGTEPYLDRFVDESGTTLGRRPSR